MNKYLASAIYSASALAANTVFDTIDAVALHGLNNQEEGGSNWRVHPVVLLSGSAVNRYRVQNYLLKQYRNRLGVDPEPSFTESLKRAFTPTAFAESAVLLGGSHLFNRYVKPLIDSSLMLRDLKETSK